MANPALSFTPLQAAVAEALDRAESRWPGPRAFSVRAFEMSAGLPNGILGKLRSGRVTYLRADMARRVSDALGIDWQILIGRDPAAPASSPRAQSTARPVTPSADHEAMIEAAYDGSRHRLGDARVVEALVTEHLAALGTASDATDVVRLWLDVAADIRRDGGVATAEAVSVEVARRLAKMRAKKP